VGVLINGKVLTRKITGVERYARETLIALDKIVAPGEYSVVIPSDRDCTNLPKFENLKLIKLQGFHNSFLWEQITLFNYIKKNDYTLINFDYATTLLKPGVSTLHDMSFKANPTFFKYSKKQRFVAKKLNVYCHFICKSNQPIVTVTEFQKKEIIKYYNVDPERIIVAGNAWQHFNEVETDDSVMDEFSLQKGEFYFSLSSNTPNKNFKWVYENALKYPENHYVIVGGQLSISDNELKNTDNIIYLGYQSDERVKSLYRNCKAFLFPSYYEGFGIPPMEALSVGTKIVVSNTSCLPEVYGGTAYYIDPNNSDVNLNELLSGNYRNGRAVLDKYNWEQTAKIWKKLMDQYK